MPSATDDPFGAMNAMAAVANVQRAPEMVIVHDGTPVEHVGQSSGSATIIKIAIPALIALIIGVAIGKIGTGASNYNGGLQGAKAILGDKQTASTVAYLKKALSDLDTLLDQAKTNHSFRPDLEVDKQLKELAAKLEVKTEMDRVLHQAEHQITDPEAVSQLLGFYAGVAEVKDMLDQHNKAAVGDDLSLKKGKEAEGAATVQDGVLAGQIKYGIVVQAPTDTDKVDFGAKLVELAGVYCGTSTNPVAKCGEGEAPSAFAYRNDPGQSPPIKGDLATSGSDSVPSKKLLLILPNGIRDALVKGTDPTVSEVFYTRRLKTIYERVHGKAGPDGKAQGGLLDDGNKLETHLQTEAAKGSRFSFFM
ncbi:MAG TPA: hypothetical protein VGF94_10385 [Kofleriaceae bacterium]